MMTEDKLEKQSASSVTQEAAPAAESSVRLDSSECSNPPVLSDTEKNERSNDRPWKNRRITIPPYHTVGNRARKYLVAFLIGGIYGLVFLASETISSRRDWHDLMPIMTMVNHPELHIEDKYEILYRQAIPLKVFLETVDFGPFYFIGFAVLACALVGITEGRHRSRIMKALFFSCWAWIVLHLSFFIWGVYENVKTDLEYRNSYQFVSFIEGCADRFVESVNFSAILSLIVIPMAVIAVVTWLCEISFRCYLGLKEKKSN